MRNGLWVFLFAAAMLASVQQVIAAPAPSGDNPLMLDLSAHFVENFVNPKQVNERFKTIAGRRMFDGVPFQMDGRATLYGKELASVLGKRREEFPEILGVKVGRTFDELHLLHATHWSDVEGMTIACIRLNYSDGSSKGLDIGYGVHVRDWQRLRSEEQEAVIPFSLMK